MPQVMQQNPLQGNSVELETGHGHRTNNDLDQGISALQEAADL
jgi:hypothetical protein